jgi:hypothetical protein
LLDGMNRLMRRGAMKRSTRVIVLVAIAAAVGAPVAPAANSWNSVRPNDVGRHHPRDVARDVARQHVRDVARAIRLTGFSDGRLGVLGLPWGGTFGLPWGG